MHLEHRLHARCGCASASGSQRESGAALGARPFAFVHSPRNFERDRPFAIAHLALDLALDVARKSVSGTATLDVVRVDPEADEIDLDAIAFELGAVTIDGAPATYRYDGRKLTLAVPRPRGRARLSIAYTATPRRGLYFLEPDEHVTDRPRQVWSQCQEEDARHFIPCHDKPHVKMTTEMNVRVPNGWYALSNGALVAAETPARAKGSDLGAPWRFHWKMEDPHPSYLITLVAGELAELTATAKGAGRGGADVPLSYLVPPGREEDGARTFARTPEMVAHFAKRTGVPYPWNKYAQVVVSDFIFGGMENTTATTMYEHILLDERASLDVTSDDLIAHELAHQWFGDFVTCRDWSEGWLNEGFATYLEHVWREERLGKDEYEYGVKVDLDAYLGEASGRYRRAIVCQDYDAPLDLFDRHLYEKGGLVLHMLRVELGEETFWRGVQVYLTRHARGVVETRDLMRALEEVSGRSLGRFFEQWVMKPGHPECDVHVGWDKKVLTVTVKQHQPTADGVPAAFELPLTVDVFDEEAAAPRREKVLVTQKSDTFALPCPSRPAFVVVDPEMRILGDVHLKAPNDMLRAALEHAPTARGRWLAALALSTSDDPLSVAALTARLEDLAEAWMVRGECADALAKIHASDAFAALARNAGTAHPKVRRAVVGALGRWKTPEAYEAIRPRALSDPSYLVESDAARALGKTRQPGAFDTLLEVALRPSWADVIAAGAVDGLAALRDERALEHMHTWTRYGRPTRVRRAAILAIPKLSTDRKAREQIEDLLGDPDPHLRIDVARALGELGDVKSRPALRERLELDLDARVRRRLREVLRDLGHDAKKLSDQLKEDFEKMQAEHAALRTRMALLEARLTDAARRERASRGASAGTFVKPAPSRARAAKAPPKAKTRVTKRAKQAKREKP